MAGFCHCWLSFELSKTEERLPRLKKKRTWERFHHIIIWKIRGKTSKLQKLKSNPHAIGLKIRFSNYRMVFEMSMVDIRTTTCKGGIGGHGCEGRIWTI